ncbi:MAG TPA: hypothetical protein DCE42_16025 [Myxococcales bacterium]|nr:hypothetical protein [Deltaproteobacteria bacterium]HAA56272.1 hypothetical protein [Myxococcales bacterium]
MDFQHLFECFFHDGVLFPMNFRFESKCCNHIHQRKSNTKTTHNNTTKHSTSSFSDLLEERLEKHFPFFFFQFREQSRLGATPKSG